jgi:hypothetical protein
MPLSTSTTALTEHFVDEKAHGHCNIERVDVFRHRDPNESSAHRALFLSQSFAFFAEHKQDRTFVTYVTIVLPVFQRSSDHLYVVLPNPTSNLFRAKLAKNRKEAKLFGL